MNKSFISQPITPEGESFGLGTMAAGEPDLASGFYWKGKSYRILEVKERWKSSGPDRGGSKERYLRKHWFRVIAQRTTPVIDPAAKPGERAPEVGETLWELEIYFDRQPTSSRAKERWWLFTKWPVEDR
jgi:hypothetical protein